MTFFTNVVRSGISSNNKQIDNNDDLPNSSEKITELTSTIAETVMYAPPEVCPECIDKILKTANRKIIERGLKRV